MRADAKVWLLLGLLLAGVTVVYLNHFDNGFHFDDAHTVENNPAIQSLSNIPRFFRDATLFSTLPDHQMYRPLVSATLAIDYRLGGGLEPFYFHLSTFIWFLAQLVCMFVLFAALLNKTAPHPRNAWLALFACAWYGLNPCCAETVNYVVQRGDLLSTLGVVAGLTIAVAWPKQRRYGIYLVPAALGALAKPPALMFAPIYFCYLLLFEEGGSFYFWERGEFGAWRRALRRSAPAAAACLGLYLLQDAMTPATFEPGGASAWRYWITQPYAAVYYAKSLFLPTELSADTDWEPFSNVFQTPAVVGLVFVAALVAIAARTSRDLETRPIAFGIFWFFSALVPTAVVPLAEVVNDHRMFFPLVGLTLAVCAWAGTTVVRRLESLNPFCDARAWVVAAAAAALPLYGWGTYKRNEVWHTEESLWLDVVEKSPRNGRGLMNYGLTQMAAGRYRRALEYFERAQALTPNYAILEINLGIVKGALGRDAEAEAHFLRAQELAPGSAQPFFTTPAGS